MLAFHNAMKNATFALECDCKPDRAVSILHDFQQNHGTLPPKKQAQLLLLLARAVSDLDVQEALSQLQEVDPSQLNDRDIVYYYNAKFTCLSNCEQLKEAAKMYDILVQLPMPRSILKDYALNVELTTKAFYLRHGPDDNKNTAWITRDLANIIINGRQLRQVRKRYRLYFTLYYALFLHHIGHTDEAIGLLNNILHEAPNLKYLTRNAEQIIAELTSAKQSPLIHKQDRR